MRISQAAEYLHFENFINLVEHKLHMFDLGYYIIAYIVSTPGSSQLFNVHEKHGRA